MRTRFKLGDLFEVTLGNGHVGYFQYVANDDTQLGSAVVRAFAYVGTSIVSPHEIILEPVKFHAHVFLRAGLTLNIWKKVGNAPSPSSVDVFFRDSPDYGNPAVTVSHDWYVWRVNEPQRRVGHLPEAFHDAEIGVVKSPLEIAERLRSGRYRALYPAF